MPNFKAQITGTASKEFTKSNGGIYVLQNCEITEGPLKGTIVSGTRTLRNATGDVKEIVPVGTQIQLFLTRVPSKDDASKMQNFFEISTGLSASQDEINAKLEAMLASTVANALEGQTF